MDGVGDLGGLGSKWDKGTLWKFFQISNKNNTLKRGEITKVYKYIKNDLYILCILVYTQKKNFLKSS